MLIIIIRRSCIYNYFSFYSNILELTICNKIKIRKDIINCRITIFLMSQTEWFTTYLEYETLKDMLKVILYTSQSFMSITPLLYYINYQDKNILFIHTGIVGGVVTHYHVLGEKPTKKFIELNKLTGEFELVENIGSNVQSIYIPIVALTKSTLKFPIE